MKIAVYYDLLPGGAFRAQEEMLEILKKHHELEIFHSPKPFPVPPILSRLFVDLESLFFQYFKQKELAKKIDSNKYDLVFVTHDFYPHSPWILRFLKTPTVFLCQEPTRSFYEKFLFLENNLPFLNKTYENINRFFRKKIEESNVLFATRVVSSSYYSSESIFRAYGVASIPARPGINPLEYYPRKLQRKNQVLIVGNNEPQKNLVSAVEVISKINKKLRPTLVIASPRPTDMKKIKVLAKRKGVNIEFFSSLSCNEMCRLYNQSQITIAVAYLEPFGLSIIESLACGTPVVAVNEGGFRETIIDGETGYLIDRDTNNIAEVIETLISSKSKMKEMGMRGIKDVNNRYTWKKTVEKLESIFYETSKRKNRHNHR